MALIVCEECGKEVSNRAATCIHCGAPTAREEVASFEPVIVYGSRWGELFVRHSLLGFVYPHRFNLTPSFIESTGVTSWLSLLFSGNRDVWRLGLKQVASVKHEQGLIWDGLLVETTGGSTATRINGLWRGDANVLWSALQGSPSRQVDRKDHRGVWITLCTIFSLCIVGFVALTVAVVVKTSNDLKASVKSTPTRPQPAQAAQPAPPPINTPPVLAARPPAEAVQEEATRQPEPAAGKDDLFIEALIDGGSSLRISGDGLMWIHRGRAHPPGRYGTNKNEPIYVNGAAWTPLWSKDGNTLTANYPRRLQPPYVYSLAYVGEERGAQGIDERTPIDISLESGVQTITIPDKQGGARWYGIRLSKGRP